MNRESGRSRRVVVVDDSPDCADSVSELIRIWGHQPVALEALLELIPRAIQA